MNNTFAFVLCIIIVVMIAQVLQTYLKQRHMKPEIDKELEESLAKIVQLEERIEVLERIITEKHYDLKREIDSL